jgi:hypothetical protein
VSGDEFRGAPTTIRPHYFWWVCVFIGINGFMALLIAKVLTHTTGVCTGLGSSCDVIFLAEASSQRLHLIVESFVWGAADLGIVLAWISCRRERMRLKRLAAIEAAAGQIGPAGDRAAARLN